jgi:hypothetical protein
MNDSFINDIKHVPRIGTIAKVTLLSGSSFMRTANEYILLTMWDGHQRNPLAFLKEGNGFDIFKVRVKELGGFEEITNILNQ